jgi:hypothetical protein
VRAQAGSDTAQAVAIAGAGIAGLATAVGLHKVSSNIHDHIFHLKAYYARICALNGPGCGFAWPLSYRCGQVHVRYSLHSTYERLQLDVITADKPTEL